MSEPRWHPEAVREVEEARDWYAERSPLAARGFLLELEKAIDTVLEVPNRWPVGKHHCRHFVFPAVTHTHWFIELPPSGSRLLQWPIRNVIQLTGRTDNRRD